jgi:hypothetical protein
MGDRTSMQVYVYDCPEDQRAGVLAILTEDYQLDGEWGAAGREVFLRLDIPYTADEISVGSADQIAAELIEAAPGCSFALWEDPKYQWLGSVNVYTPALGLFSAECDANGQPVYTAREITDMITKAGDVDQAGLIAAIQRTTGGAWFADWDAHR